MADREQILKKVTKTEDRLLVAKVLDKAEISEKRGCAIYSDFFDPHQKNIIEKILTGIPNINYTFNGGYMGAEREIVIFHPHFAFNENNCEDIPLKVVKISLLGRESLSHRDFLGSLMGLGIKREKVGDILVGEDYSNVLVMADIAEYIKYNLESVGNTKVSIEIKELDEINAVERKTREINATVASLRLDTVAGIGFGISRSKMADFIKAEKVTLNWEVTSSTTKLVKEGDVISIRGKGRVVVDNIGGKSRKDRIFIKLMKLI